MRIYFHQTTVKMYNPNDSHLECVSILQSSLSPLPLSPQNVCFVAEDQREEKQFVNQWIRVSSYICFYFEEKLVMEASAI